MQRWTRFAWSSLGLFQVMVFLASTVKPAHAYVDPGSGLLFFQVGGSMLAGAMFVLRSKIRKLFRLGSPGMPSDAVKKEDAAKSAGCEA